MPDIRSSFCKRSYLDSPIQIGMKTKPMYKTTLTEKLTGYTKSYFILTISITKLTVGLSAECLTYNNGYSLYGMMSVLTSRHTFRRLTVFWFRY